MPFIALGIAIAAMAGVRRATSRAGGGRVERCSVSEFAGLPYRAGEEVGGVDRGVLSLPFMTSLARLDCCPGFARPAPGAGWKSQRERFGS
jgi:hypothetical protein